MLGLHETFRSATAGLVAHQGGWDEILLIAGPMVAIALLLAVAKRRVDAAARGTTPSDGAITGDKSTDDNSTVDTATVDTATDDASD